MLVIDTYNIADALLNAGIAADRDNAQYLRSRTNVSIHCGAYTGSMVAFRAMVESARNLDLHTDLSSVTSGYEAYYVFKVLPHKNARTYDAIVTIFSPHFPKEIVDTHGF